MPLYFFNTRDNDDMVEDHIGTECRDLEAAKIEAAMTLAGLARDVLPGSSRRELAIEVRDDQGPVLMARMTFEAKMLRAGGKL